MEHISVIVKAQNVVKEFSTSAMYAFNASALYLNFDLGHLLNNDLHSIRKAVRSMAYYINSETSIFPGDQQPNKV